MKFQPENCYPLITNTVCDYNVLNWTV
uniref:Uncharacterized protein n=1 Tax=Anguilla anguilla TaxID=7936 RepID=A0A0E9UYT1_ANGAN